MIIDKLKDNNKERIFQEIMEHYINKDILISNKKAIKEEAIDLIPVSQAIKALELLKLFEL